jgi:hypothetical protein
MIIEIDDKEIEVDEEDLNSLLGMLNKQAREYDAKANARRDIK